ncbi:MAG: alpha-L-fucosidase [Clostridia bacterium]|nr:alpha-L-fucosidase [Clostridia bacterium]
MIVEKRILDIEKLGLGMFVHFGSYSVHGRGEWARLAGILTNEEYDDLCHTFCPKPDWARELCAVAKAMGCRYVTLTTRHHDGYSLFDTCGLNEYDAPHTAPGRDLVREFCDACREAGLVPFFYHTLLDWHEPSYRENFKEYLVYLRRSVEILCKNYGKIGGLWFDGWWNKPDADWEFDELYGTIRRYQPDAMIINNTGLSRLGEAGHPEIDSVTFERGKPSPLNREDSPKYLASEMCEVLGTHWGYAELDFNYKSLATIIETLCACRRAGANMLLNVGPMGDGSLRPLDREMLLALGKWVEIHKEALYLPRPAEVEITGNEKDFLLRGDGCYYLFIHNIPKGGSQDVVLDANLNPYADVFTLPESVRAIRWLDSGLEVPYLTEGDRVTVCPTRQPYGEDFAVKIARIEVEA